MPCPQGHPVVDGDPFCSTCGFPVTPAPPARRCAASGHNMQPEDDFCGQCGAKPAPISTLPTSKSGVAALPTGAFRAAETRSWKQFWLSLSWRWQIAGIVGVGTVAVVVAVSISANDGGATVDGPHTANPVGIVGKTRLGCPILKPIAAISGVFLVPPECTEGAMIVRYCGLSEDDLLLPNPDNPADDTVHVRTYRLRSTGMTVLVESSADSTTVRCPSGDLTFSQADLDLFTKAGDVADLNSVVPVRGIP